MSEWIEWKGGERPVRGAVTMVDIQLRDGSVMSNYSAGSLNWENLGYVGDITAYRVSEQKSMEEAYDETTRGIRVEHVPTGTKHDSGKAPLGLISSVALTEEALVLAFGAKKYAAHNWRGGIAWSRVYDGIQRHLVAWNAGEDTDPETGRSHLAHARCGLGFLLDYSLNHQELDDRYKPESK